MNLGAQHLGRGLGYILADLTEHLPCTFAIALSVVPMELLVENGGDKANQQGGLGSKN